LETFKVIGLAHLIVLCVLIKHPLPDFEEQVHHNSNGYSHHHGHGDNN
jgi:hypothetical protein